MKIIGMIGSRDRIDPDDFMLMQRKFFELYEFGDSIISGGCKTGGDNFAELIAIGLGFEKIELDFGEKAPKLENKIFLHLPDWELLGRRAGYVRNEYIARDCDILIALFCKARPGGTQSTINYAKGFDKDVYIL